MRQIISLFLFLSGFLFTIDSQWIQQPSGRTTELRIAYFLNSSTGFIISKNYSINRNILLKTTNQGISWDSTTFLSSDTLYNIFFINQSTGWLCGNNAPAEVMPKGKIWKTTNQGATWTSILFNDSTTIASVFFVDINTGYAAGLRTPLGALVYKTTDNGVNWNLFNNISVTLRGARDLYFLNSNTGWIAAANGDAENQFPTIIKTTNGGINWSFNNIGGWIRTVLAHIVFLNDLTGYAGGSRDTTILGTTPLPRMFKSTNGGVSWVYQDLPTTISPNIHFINGMYFQDVNSGWAVGDRGSICYTSNGGTNWVYQNSGQNTTINLIDVYFNSGIGWVIGNNGTVLKTTNGGITFVNPVNGNIPNDYKLHQNYPNPFNPVTKIKFELPQNSNVKLSLFDITGKEVSLLINSEYSAGIYEFTLDSKYFSISSGIYFYKFESSKFNQVMKMILIK